MIPAEPPVGTWMRDRFGGTTMRQPDGWGAPGVMPFGRWSLMWEARGPFEQCGPWGAPLVLCDDRGPRIGNEGQPRCRLHKHHDGLHTSALSDGWDPVITWGDLAPREKNMSDGNPTSFVDDVIERINQYLDHELPDLRNRAGIAKDIAEAVCGVELADVFLDGVEPLVKQPGSDPALDLLILDEEIIELETKIGHLQGELQQKTRRAQDLRAAIGTLQNYGYKV